MSGTGMDRPFEDEQKEKLRLEWVEISRELPRLEEALNRARRVAAATGRYSDPKWFTKLEADVKAAKARRIEIQVEFTKINAAQKAANRDEMRRRHDTIHSALCAVLLERFGRATLYALLAEAHAKLEGQAAEVVQ